MNSNWPSESHFLHADQDEIDTHFKWIADDLDLLRVERTVLGAPNIKDRLRLLGANTLKAAVTLIGHNLSP